jgi:hypothetical protein
LRNIAMRRLGMRSAGTLKLTIERSGRWLVRRLGILKTLLLVLGLAAALPAQNLVGLGTLEGQVLDAHGRPVADASVTIQTSDGLHPHATHTDANGHFQFQRYSAGQYDVRAYSRGSFSDWNKRLVIRPKKTTDIILTLPADSAETVVVPSK